jgi:hypothetical protein
MSVGKDIYKGAIAKEIEGEQLVIYPKTSADMVVVGDSTLDSEMTKIKNNSYHPTNTARTSGLYNITVDTYGHVTGATKVTTSDLTALGVAESTSVEKVHKVEEFLIYFNDWDDGILDLSSKYPDDKYNVYMDRSSKMDKNQATALANAIICGDSTSNKFKCLGTVPTIDIWVMLEIVEK